MLPRRDHFRFRPMMSHQSKYCYSRKICDFGEFNNRLIRLSKCHNKKLPIISPIINALESNPDYKWLDDVTMKLDDDVIIGRSKSFSRKPEIKN